MVELVVFLASWSVCKNVLGVGQHVRCTDRGTVLWLLIYSTLQYWSHWALCTFGVGQYHNNIYYTSPMTVTISRHHNRVDTFYFSTKSIVHTLLTIILTLMGIRAITDGMTRKKEMKKIVSNHWSFLFPPFSFSPFSPPFVIFLPPALAQLVERQTVVVQQSVICRSSVRFRVKRIFVAGHINSSDASCFPHPIPVLGYSSFAWVS